MAKGPENSGSFTFKLLPVPRYTEAMKLRALFRSIRYESIAFLTGASVMVLEIVGARLIAPAFGTSTYVWTAMIGVILGSLALGFWIGGKAADRNGSAAYLGFLLFAAALLVLGMGLVQQRILSDIAGLGLDLRLGVLLGALLLFSLPSVLIGMVSPHLAKIRVTSLKTTGTSIGRLEAAGALGSIAGTFACGYLLLGLFGSRSIVIGIVVVLLITSFIADPYFWRKLRFLSFVVALPASLVMTANPPAVLADVDSSYARYQVVERTYGNETLRMLMTDHRAIQSAVSTASPDLLKLAYAQRFQQVALAYGNPEKVLVIGGGTYTFPEALVKTLPTVQVDVAEIDPTLRDLAKQYFFFEDSSRLRIHHVDGRTYLNRNTTQYDLIYMDAFSSLSPPFQLTTKQTVQGIKAGLAPEGVAVVNVIGDYENGTSDYLRAMRATYQSVFTHTAMFQMNPQYDINQVRQNFLLLAANSPDAFARVAKQINLAPLTFEPGGLVLTDDYAPIERLTY